MPAPVTTLGDWNYQPHESIPNALTFTDANNRPMTLTGGAATELAQRVDEFKAMRERAAQVGPQRTAEVRQQVAPGSRSVRIVADVPAAVAAQPAPVAAPPQTAPVSVQRAPSAVPAPTVVASGPRAGFTNLGFGKYRSPDGQIGTFTRGSPAVTKEMLEQRRADLVAMPTGMSASRSGGFEPSKEYLEEKAQIYTERADLAEQIRGENARKILAEQSDRANQQKLAAEQLADQQRLQQEIDSRVKKDEEIAERARKEYSSAGVNPGRLFQGEGGAARALVSGIASALGAAGAVLGRVDNFAQKMIDSAIERDIRAQENEIAVKRDATDNAMAQLQRSGLTRDQSRLVLRQAQRDWVAAQAESMRVAAKLDENSSQYQNLMLGLRDEEADFREKYRQLSLGTRAEQVTSGFAAPRGATGGGFAPDRDQIKTGKELQSIRSEEAGIAKTEADTVKALRGVDTEEGAKASAAERREMDLMGDLQARVRGIVQAHGGTIDPVTGKISGASFPSGIALSDADTDKKVKVESELTEIGGAYANFINGGAEAPPAAKEAMTPKLEGSFGIGAGPESQLEAIYQGALVRQAQRAQRKGAAAQSPAAGSAQQIDLKKE